MSPKKHLNRDSVIDNLAQPWALGKTPVAFFKFNLSFVQIFFFFARCQTKFLDYIASAHNFKANRPIISFIFSSYYNIVSYICFCLPPDRIWHKVKWPEGRIIVRVMGGESPAGLCWSSAHLVQCEPMSLAGHRP